MREPLMRARTAGWLAGMLLVLLAVPAAHAAAAAFEADSLSAEAREWVTANGPLRIGWFVGAPPVSVWEDGELTGGYATEAWDLAAVKLSIQIEHVVYPGIPEVVAALQAGEIDVAGAHGERPDLLAFAVPTEPTAWERITFVTRPDRVDDFGAFDAGTATTIAGSPLEAALLDGFPGFTYVQTQTLPDGVAAVARGEIDLYLGPLATLGSLIRQQELDLVPVGEAVQVIPIGSWVLPDTPAAEIAEAARASLTSAELATLHVRWTGFDLSDPSAEATLPAWLVPTVIGLGAMLVLAAVFVLVLRQRVSSATRELREVNEGLEAAVTERTAELSDTASRLRRSNTALKRFTSTAAHDLKGPLTAIGGLADVALRMDLPEEQKNDVLMRVRDSSQRLGRMVNDMLEDAVHMGADVASLSGPLFVDWLREVTAPELEVIAGRLVVVAPDEPIDVDVEVLRRAAINLVGNAVKYAVNESGMLVHVVLSREADVWQLRVDDNGPGIPPAMWSEIFERGKRLTHDDRGFGLGLAAIRDLVQGAGGAIRVGEADLGGASFVVTLPKRAPTAPVVLDEGTRVEPTATGD